MRQTAMARGVRIASSRAVAAAVAAAAALAAAAVAGHHDECGEGQATNSAGHLVHSLAGALASTRQSEDTLMLAV